MFGAQSFIPEEFCDDHPVYKGKTGGSYCDSPTQEAVTLKEIETKLGAENPGYLQDLQSEWNQGNFYILLGILQDTEQRPIYRSFEKTTPSRHLTIVFNMFVFMQVFNMISARKIHDQLNIFEGIFTNPAFLIVWSIIAVFQVICTQFFGFFMQVHENGLTGPQWAYSLLIALLVFPINLFLKFVPDHICPVLGDEDPEDVKNAE